MKILELLNVEKIYGEKENQVNALRNINFQMEEGEFAAIVGTSGSGKSTLLNLIGGLDQKLLQIPDRQKTAHKILYGLGIGIAKLLQLLPHDPAHGLLGHRA